MEELQLFHIPANTSAFLNFSHSGEKEVRIDCSLVFACPMDNEVMVPFLFMGHMVRRVCWEFFICFLTELAVFSVNVLHINTWAEAINLFGT